MASASPSMDVKEEVQCPICVEYLTDPVTLDCGHNFCRGCITRYCETWEELGDLECPLCKARIKKGNFRPNWQLANIVDKIKRLSLKLGKEDLCVRHKEKLNLFCKDDQELVCVGCERSPEHQSHTVLLLEDAALEYGGQLRSCLEVLRKERERILVMEAGTEKESQELLRQTEAEKTKTETAFNQLHQFLEEQKTHFLSQMEELEKEIKRRREQHMARLWWERSSLGGLIQQMEEKCQQPPSELLQDIRRTLQRYEKKERFENPVAFPPELTCRIGEFRDVKPFLEGVRKQFPAEMLRQTPLQEWPRLTKESSQREVSELTGKVKVYKFSIQEPMNEDGNLPTEKCILPSKLAVFGKGREWKPVNDRQVSPTSVPANVTLDPDTAHPQLILSEDHKSVRWGDERQFLPKNPERFDCCFFVLGHEGFTTGRHFWNVDVGNEDRWAVGVAKKSVRRKGWFDISPKEGIWAVGKWGGQYKAFAASDHIPLSLGQELRRIQVTLNCAEGQVAFSYANALVHLHTYSGVPLCGETLHPFFCVIGEAHLKLSP